MVGAGPKLKVSVIIAIFWIVLGGCGSTSPNAGHGHEISMSLADETTSGLYNVVDNTCNIPIVGNETKIQRTFEGVFFESEVENDTERFIANYENDYNSAGASSFYYYTRFNSLNIECKHTFHDDIWEAVCPDPADCSVMDCELAENAGDCYIKGIKKESYPDLYSYGKFISTLSAEYEYSDNLTLSEIEGAGVDQRWADINNVIDNGGDIEGFLGSLSVAVYIINNDELVFNTNIGESCRGNSYETKSLRLPIDANHTVTFSFDLYDESCLKVVATVMCSGEVKTDADFTIRCDFNENNIALYPILIEM